METPKTTMRFRPEDRGNLESIKAALGLDTDAAAIREALRTAAARLADIGVLDRPLAALKLNAEDRDLILVQVYGAAARAYIEAQERGKS